MHSKYRRNAYWKNIVAKAGGYEVRKVFEHKDEELLFLVEQERIDQLRRLGFKLANLTDGGEGPSGYRHTEETKRLIAELQMGEKHWAYGKQVSDEERARLSQIAKRKHTDEHRKKVSEAGKKRINSPATRAKISVAKQNGKHHMANMVEYDGKIFECVKDLATYVGINYSTMRSRVRLYSDKFGYKLLGYTKDLKGETND